MQCFQYPMLHRVRTPFVLALLTALAACSPHSSQQDTKTASAPATVTASAPAAEPAPASSAPVQKETQEAGEDGQNPEKSDQAEQPAADRGRGPRIKGIRIGDSMAQARSAVAVLVNGLVQGLDGVKNIELIEINVEDSLRYLSSKVKDGKFEIDTFPVYRGTTIVESDDSALLWVHGATPSAQNKYWRYYQGKRRIPAPLRIRRFLGQSDVVQCATEILGLAGVEVDPVHHDKQEASERDELKNQLFKLAGLPLIRVRADDERAVRAEDFYDLLMAQSEALDTIRPRRLRPRRTHDFLVPAESSSRAWASKVV